MTTRGDDGISPQWEYDEKSLDCELWRLLTIDCPSLMWLNLLTDGGRRRRRNKPMGNAVYQLSFLDVTQGPESSSSSPHQTGGGRDAQKCFHWKRAEEEDKKSSVMLSWRVGRGFCPSHLWWIGDPPPRLTFVKGKREKHDSAQCPIPSASNSSLGKRSGWWPLTRWLEAKRCNAMEHWLAEMTAGWRLRYLSVFLFIIIFFFFFFFISPVCGAVLRRSRCV